ncbi:MAG: DUF1801 domain-containing protein [Vicinamibacteria bacterium]
MTGRRARRPRERKARPEVPPSVERYILAQRPRHRPLLRLLRKVVRDALPEAGEELKWGQPCYLVGGEKVACLCVIGDHVNLGFFRGAAVDGSEGSLDGSGKGMRHITVGVPSDIKRREFTILLRQAAGLETSRYRTKA